MKSQALQDAIDSMPARAHAALVRTIEQGSRHYDRDRHLPRLLRRPTGITPLGAYYPPAMHGDMETLIEGRVLTHNILKRLRAMRTNERRAGREGSWAFDLNSLIALRQAIRAELRISREQRAAMADIYREAAQ